MLSIQKEFEPENKILLFFQFALITCACHCFKFLIIDTTKIMKIFPVNQQKFIFIFKLIYFYICIMQLKNFVKV